jgi:hypothetical protein
VSVLALVTFVATASEPQTAATSARASRSWQRIDVPVSQKCLVLTFDPKNPQRIFACTDTGTRVATLENGDERENSDITPLFYWFRRRRGRPCASDSPCLGQRGN